MEGACTCVAVCGGMYVSTPRHLDTSTPRHSPTHPDTPTPRHSDTPTLLDTRRALPLSRSPDTGPDRGRHLRHQCQPTLARHWPDTARHPSTPSTLRHTRAQTATSHRVASVRELNQCRGRRGSHAPWQVYMYMLVHAVLQSEKNTPTTTAARTLTPNSACGRTPIVHPSRA